MQLDVSYASAALAGLASFLSPCILPMVPFYLTYMAGISMQELDESVKITRAAQRRLILSAVLFSAGVITVFMLLGLSATMIGQLVRDYNTALSWAAAALLALFGLHFLGVVKIPLFYREARLDSSSVKRSSYLGSFLIGLAFGFGWTPCVGPALSAILYLATQQDTLRHGAGLLAVYGIFMTAPFVLAAAFSGPFLRWVQRNRRYMGIMEKLMGAFLILFAILIVTGGIAKFSTFLFETFPDVFVFG